MSKVDERRKYFEDILKMFRKAKQVWDSTLDVKEVADELGISKMEAISVCSFLATDEQIKQLQDESEDFD